MYKNIMKRTVSLLLAFSFILSMFPMTVLAEETDTRTVITEVEGTTDTDISSKAVYGTNIVGSKLTFTVTKGSPAYFKDDMGDWQKKNGSEWENVYNGTFTDGLWRYKTQIRVDGEYGSTHKLSSNVTVKVNGSAWETDYLTVMDNYSYVTIYSQEFTIVSDGTFSFGNSSSYNIPTSNVGVPITSFSVSSTVSGGTTPYTFSKTSGPDWITVSNDGTISGTPTTTGNNSALVVRVTDNNGDYKEITITVGATVIVVPEIEATSNISSKAISGASVSTSKPTFTLTKGSPAYFNDDMGFWQKKNDSKWENVYNGTLTEGSWRYKIQIRIDGEYGSTHKLSSDVTVKVDGAAWDTDSVTVMDSYSYVTAYSNEITINKESQTTHTVTFNAGTRASFDNATVNDGDAVSKPYEGEYKVDGWNIAGWFTEPELENVYTFGDPVTADLNLYAKWNGTAYIYTYDLTNDTQKTNTCGTVSMTGYSGKYYNNALGSCAENTEYTATANPAEGYKFKEWRIGSPNATSAGTESTYTFKLTDSSSIVIYAVFEEDVAPTVYNLWIGDTQVTSANASDILEDGKISYDVATNALTLNGATITGGGNEDQGYGIKYQGNTDLTIVANGTNTISDNGTRKTGSAGILLGGNMGEYYGETYTRSEYKANLILNIDEGATLTINGGTATGGYYPTSYGICMWQDEGNVTINGAGTLNVNGGNANYSYGMVPANKLVFDMTGKATITGADSDYWSCGISANDIYFTNGTIEVNSGSAMQSYAITTENGMFYDAGDISIDNADVTVVSGTVPTNKDGSGKSYGIFAGRNFVIDGGSLLVKSSETGDVTMALNKAPELGIEGIVGASETSTGKKLVVYVEDNNDSYKYFKVPCEGYTVAYDINGGTVAGGELTTRIVASGDTFKLPLLNEMPEDDYHIGVHPPEDKWFDAFEVSGERYDEGAKITITGNTVIKYLWKDITYVDKVELTIEAPIFGTKIEGEYDEVLGHIAHDSINVRPVVTLPEDADYTIESDETYWTTSGDYNPYIGEIEAGKTYNASVYVYCEDDSYQFLEEGLEVVVNGEKITSYKSYGFWVNIDYPMVATEEETNKYLLKVNIGDGVGNISVVPSGDEPDFEYPTTSVAYKEDAGTQWLLAAKPNEDYRFVNWTKSGDDTFTDTNPQITIELTEDVEYLANFELIEYNVTYDANGGTGTMSGETSKYYIFPSCDYTAPSGKTFDKWEVNGKTYKVGDTLTLTEDITVKATWKNKSTSSGGGGGSSSSSYKITTKIENGTITPANTSVKKNADQEFAFKANDGYEITDVLVDGKSVGVVDSYKLEKVTAKHTIEVKTAKVSALSSVDDWAKEEMAKADEKGLIPETFAKKDATKAITRLDFAAVAVKLYEAISKVKATPTQNNPFTDTNDEYVLKAYALGITKGTSETTFTPNAEITREQMATMLTRALTKAGINTEYDITNTTRFADDNELSDWGRPSVYFMAKEEIIKGIGDNRFNGLGNAKVEEAIAIALRSVEIFGK